MTDEEFRDWLEDEVQHERMTSAQRDDMLQQKNFFDAHRAEIEQQHHGRIVGYVCGKREVSGEIQELLARVQKTYPGRMVYLEPVGFELW